MVVVLEPTVGVDPGMQAHIIEIIVEIRSKEHQRVVDTVKLLIFMVEIIVATELVLMEELVAMLTECKDSLPHLRIDLALISRLPQ
jgi:ABC-type Mn2+/Zn2+ transport system ATPase subunit